MNILEEYGGVVRWNGPLCVRLFSCRSSVGAGHTLMLTMQRERLWVADPKAIHHILQATSYLYQKSAASMELLETILDKGLVSVEGAFPFVDQVAQLLIVNLGDVHKRQRRVMTPAFGLVEAKALYPYFIRCSNSVSCFPIHT
jgi:cytochrome P450